ncbi:tellurite resistance TerB family protein [uncultured Devosia sp.]|uniref:tellurite resistance TerB family protein n=1 Tax=uncultured Devosia sp. TaxID=211434 RepID=UPI0035CA9952
MSTAAQDALIQLMVVAASSDDAMSERELRRIETLVGRLPAFEGFDKGRITAVANACIDTLNGSHGLDQLVDDAIAALPVKMQDTAYALVVEITAVDLQLTQEELRFLELVRDKMELDRLVTAAIETAARARHRRMPR